MLILGVALMYVCITPVGNVWMWDVAPGCLLRMLWLVLVSNGSKYLTEMQ